ERTARERDVARAQNVFQVRGCDAVGGKAKLGVVEVDGFRQNAFAVDLGDFGCALQSAGHQVGKVVEIVVRVAVAGHGLKLGGGFRGIVNESRCPRIGMKL